MEDKKKYPRYCSVTGTGMYRGWVINNGERYVKDLYLATIEAQKAGYTSVTEAYEAGYMYWSEWNPNDIDDKNTEQ